MTHQITSSRQWRSHWGGKGGGQSATPDSEKLPKIGENQEKIGKKSGKIGKKRKNREEKAKIGKFLSLCLSWQIGLATLLPLDIPKGNIW